MGGQASPKGGGGGVQGGGACRGGGGACRGVVKIFFILLKKGEFGMF